MENHRVPQRILEDNRTLLRIMEHHRTSQSISEHHRAPWSAKEHHKVLSSTMEQQSTMEHNGTEHLLPAGVWLHAFHFHLVSHSRASKHSLLPSSPCSLAQYTREDRSRCGRQAEPCYAGSGPPGYSVSSSAGTRFGSHPQTLVKMQGPQALSPAFSLCSTHNPPFLLSSLHLLPHGPHKQPFISLQDSFWPSRAPSHCPVHLPNEPLLRLSPESGQLGLSAICFSSTAPTLAKPQALLSGSNAQTHVPGSLPFRSPVLIPAYPSLHC